MARMELPVLDKFCFIFQLKTGCIAMGIINLLLTFIQAILLVTFADAMSVRSEQADDAGLSNVVYTIVVLLAALLLLKLLMELVFVWAVYKERSSVLKKYCIFWMVFLVLFVIGFLKTLFHMDAGQVISNVLYLAENFYFIIVIRSYLISINEDGVL